MSQENFYIEEDEIDVSKIFKEFKAHIKAIAIIMVVTLLLGYIFTITRTKKYKSSATMAVMYTGATNESTYTNYSFSVNAVDTFVLFLSENIVLDKVEKKTGYKASKIKNNLTVENDNLIITLTYKDTNQKNAKIILDTVMNTAIEVANTKDKDGNPKYKMLMNNLQIFSSASKAKPISNLKRNMIIFFAGGLFLSCLYVLICWLLDRRYKDAEQIEEDLDIPVFTSVPYYRFDERKHKR